MPDISRLMHKITTNKAATAYAFALAPINLPHLEFRLPTRSHSSIEDGKHRIRIMPLVTLRGGKEVYARDTDGRKVHLV